MKLPKEIILITGTHPQIHAIADYLSHRFEVHILSHIKRHSSIETAIHHLQEEIGHNLTSVIYLKPHGIEAFIKKLEKFFKTEQLITRSFLSTPQRFKVVNLDFAETYDDEGHSPFLEKQFLRRNEHKILSGYFPSNYFRFHSQLHLSDLSEALLHLIDKRQDLPQLLNLYLRENDMVSVAEIQNVLGDILSSHHKPHHLSYILKEVSKEIFWDEDDDQVEIHELIDWRPQRKLREDLPKIIEFMRHH